ncbi:PREDICTED: disintegrin and metalloproteinase domain-containing protein 2 [Miniopterus natalensis]|uniref:disintegrin and metalloproteinase domain-containing protein 2 n=1 Tax=Miniopterus natalensis TaxID=291302 RepID=UPI0007A6EECA|nr:PREDICTED: disintegrin and metalloproteinase domain-containing protein 2 [Miniopterus natalensis]
MKAKNINKILRLGKCVVISMVFHSLHLNLFMGESKQRTFLPPSFRIYVYNGTGYMKPFEQQIQNFCYFQGHIEGYSNSMVILSTCTGLRGLLQFENVSYAIEPLEPSIGFEHVVYQVSPKKTGASLYAEEDTETREISYKIYSMQPAADFLKYIETHIVVEKNLYNHMGSDTAVVTQKIFQLIALTNAIFTPFSITIILSSLELWIDENKISVIGDVDELLHRFLKWKRSYLVLRPHDMAFLLVYREISDYVGASFQGKMCDRQYGGSIVLHPKAISLESLSVVVSQLLSLNMGIAYDDIDKCQCSGAVCIMNPEAIHSSGVKFFSNCSMEDFARFISKPKSHCLQNHPPLDPSYKAAVCGNKIVEEGEACDCGTPEECAEMPSSCCDAASCTIKPGNNCDTGLCCENCKFVSKGEECRAAYDECDLAEYCNGSSDSCPEDLYVHNGMPCDQNQFLCFNGHCISERKQCMDTFGQGTLPGTTECYQYLNSMTDESGNCGSNASGYKKCEPKDVRCGKLVCKYEGENILQIQDATVIYSKLSKDLCVSLEYKWDHPESSKMWVKDGTSCGEQLICRDKQCIISDLVYDCPEKCNNHGKCNNKKNCHCDAPFLPPTCRNTQDLWPGGSINSGNFPPVIIGRSSDRWYNEDIYPSKAIRWPLFLLIPFCIILCVMIATLVKVYLQRKKWKTEEYISDEELESESEPKSGLENKESIIS